MDRYDGEDTPASKGGSAENSGLSTGALSPKVNPGDPSLAPITYLHIMVHHRVQHLQVSQKLPKEGDTLGKQSKSGMNPCSQVSSQTLPSEPATLSLLAHPRDPTRTFRASPQWSLPSLSKNSS